MRSVKKIMPGRNTLKLESHETQNTEILSNQNPLYRSQHHRKKQQGYRAGH